MLHMFVLVLSIMIYNTSLFMPRDETISYLFLKTLVHPTLFKVWFHQEL